MGWNTAPEEASMRVRLLFRYTEPQQKAACVTARAAWQCQAFAWGVTTADTRKLQTAGMQFVLLPKTIPTASDFTELRHQAACVTARAAWQCLAFAWGVTTANT